MRIIPSALRARYCCKTCNTSAKPEGLRVLSQVVFGQLKVQAPHCHSVVHTPCTGECTTFLEEKPGVNLGISWGFPEKYRQGVGTSSMIPNAASPPLCPWTEILLSLPPETGEGWGGGAEAVGTPEFAYTPHPNLPPRWGEEVKKYVSGT